MNEAPSTLYSFKNLTAVAALFLQHAEEASHKSERTKQLREKYTLAQEAKTWALAAGILANTRLVGNGQHSGQWLYSTFAERHPQWQPAWDKLSPNLQMAWNALAEAL